MEVDKYTAGEFYTGTDKKKKKKLRVWGRYRQNFLNLLIHFFNPTWGTVNHDHQSSVEPLVKEGR